MLSPLQPTLYCLCSKHSANHELLDLCTNHGMTQRLVNFFLGEELLARRRSLLITTALNFAPQTLTFAPHMLYHSRNLPFGVQSVVAVFENSSL